ncbi:hypothetical protein B296_00004326 [Ensete ventricosum]|uniref:Uncharacterized protein n=1 Tax=Ensete ventricosum TaxID=4639 RepID=A0A426ZKD6_ENSVE|nr:hypothetical protein B296_00004326 [Ensete ventricosum]
MKQKGVCQKKTETRRKILGVAKKLTGNLTIIGLMELQPDNGLRSNLGIRLGSDDAVGSHREFARRFTKGIGKLIGNMREIIERSPEDLPQEYRRLLDWR